ncbi:MAG: class I SAM-dependent methyltransferase [bacterium]|nr:class I SAM-dependent methyltransferase [bacterium]MDE0601245.1 class I SAM-dependent methyltransferase [bacterium]
MGTEGPGGADWEDIYLGDGSDIEPFDHQLLEEALALPPGRVLDLGCGAGGNLIGLARRGWTATGVDSSSRAIQSARIGAGRAQVTARLHRADMLTWKPEGLYDLVISSYSLPPRGPARDALLSIARRTLAPGGMLIVGEWDAEGAVGGDPDHFATLAELTAAFVDLVIVRAESVDADPRIPGREDVRNTAWRAVKVVARRP